MRSESILMLSIFKNKILYKKSLSKKLQNTYCKYNTNCHAMNHHIKKYKLVIIEEYSRRALVGI